MLQAENYAQAQRLITTYIETPTENVVQRSSQERTHTLTEEDQQTIDEFQLFVSPEKNESKIEIDINDYISDTLQIPEQITDIDLNDFLNLSPMIPHAPTEIIDNEKPSLESSLDSLLNMDANDVLTDNIDLNINYVQEDNFFTFPHRSSKTDIPISDIPKDNFFDVPDEEILDEKNETIDMLDHAQIQDKQIKETEITLEEMPEVEDEIILAIQDERLEKELKEEEKDLKTLSPLLTIAEIEIPSQYKRIPHIAQKLESMHKQYPSPHSNHEPFSSLNDLLTKISQEPYSEAEIEEILVTVMKLVENNELSQASQLLLVSAATESPFAQLILARELYKGILLTQNIPQAFILLNTLAMDDYPEALCDLAQFYENGIGTKKDKKRAQELYENAMKMGVRRAKKHFERMNKQNKGFFRK